MQTLNISNAKVKKRAKEPLVLMGCSGGQDSVFALFLLSRLSLGLKVFHANHVSCVESAETAFELIKLCQVLQIPISNHMVVCKLSSVRLKKIKYHKVSENGARLWRYNSWQRSAAYNTSSICVTAHTATDRVETSLVNVFRGTRSQQRFGFSQPSYTRPFQWVTRWESKLYCARYLLPVSLDMSNLDVCQKSPRRNQIRQLLLPLCENIFCLSQTYSSQTYLFQRSVEYEVEYLRTLASYIYTHRSLPFLPRCVQSYCISCIMQEYVGQKLPF